MSNASLPADFLDAMDRHWRDAELLRRSQRLANADHLYGLAGECGLKAIMQKRGMEMQGNRPKERDDRKHINNDLVDRYERYETYRDTYIDGPCSSLPWQDHFPFENWDVSDRYANRDHFAEDRLEKH